MIVMVMAYDNRIDGRQLPHAHWRLPISVWSFRSSSARLAPDWVWNIVYNVDKTWSHGLLEFVFVGHQRRRNGRCIAYFFNQYNYIFKWKFEVCLLQKIVHVHVSLLFMIFYLNCCDYNAVIGSLFVFVLREKIVWKAVQLLIINCLPIHGCTPKCK